MKTLKTVVVPATPETTKEVEDKTLCDLCGKVIDVRGYDVDEVEIKITHTKGESYPEAAYLTESGFDVCGECFTTKLVPWMKAQRATGPTVRDAGWG